MKKILFGLLLVATFILGGCANITSYEECIEAGNPMIKTYPAMCKANGETFTQEINSNITNFEECVAAGYPVMESYPRQCAAFGETFTEEIEERPIGGDTDEHGCSITTGYQWCPSTQQCQRMWETYCEEYAEHYQEPGSWCAKEGGKWYDMYNECEGISQALCEEHNGTYNGCASACRHDPDAEFCTMQCIQTCTFE